MDSHARNRPTVQTRRENRFDTHDVLGVALTLVGQGRQVFGWVENLNSKGMKVWCDDKFSSESECVFHLLVGEGEGHVAGRAWVVYVDDTGMALQFDRLEPKTLAAINQTAGPFRKPDQSAEDVWREKHPLPKVE